jgi:membrane-associated phospholipid phosphatase
VVVPHSEAFLRLGSSEALIRELQAAIPPAGWFLVRLGSALGSTWGILLVTGVARVLLGRRAAYALLALAASTVPTYMGLAFLTNGERPSGEGIVAHEQVSVPALPSGHLSVATALYGYLVWRGHLPPWALVVVLPTVAFCRLALGMHAAEDLVAGALLGAAMLVCFAMAWPRIAPRLATLPRRFYVSMGLGSIATVIAVVVLTGSNATAMQAIGLVSGVSLGLLLDAYALPQTGRWHLPGGVLALAWVGGLSPSVVWGAAAEGALPLWSGALAAALAGVILFAFLPRAA